jgi:hypothetical protein
VLLDILSLVIDKHEDAAEEFFLKVGLQFGISAPFGLQPLEELATDSLVVSILDQPGFLRVHALE